MTDCRYCARSLALALVVALLLGGCASSVRTYEEAFAGARREVDPYQRVTRVRSARLGSNFDMLQARLIASTTGVLGFRALLCIDYHGDSWMFLTHVIDADGKRFDDPNPSREVGYGGRVYETAAVFVDVRYLLDHREGGIQLRAYGDRGWEDLAIPGWFIAAFIDAVQLQPEMRGVFDVPAVPAEPAAVGATP